MFVIDRFEGEYALIGHRKRIFHIPKSLIPKGAKEGDVINILVTVDGEACGKKKETAVKRAGGAMKDQDAGTPRNFPGGGKGMPKE